MMRDVSCSLSLPRALSVLFVKLQGVFILGGVELLKRKYFKEYAKIAA
jgi:hypothetical protein